MIKAAIFDLDGTISDTQKLHAMVESEILARYGVVMSPEEITLKYAGMSTRKVFDDLLKDTGLSYDCDEIMNEKRSRMLEIAEKSVDPIDGSIELIKKLHSEGFKLAVASASHVNYVEKVVKSLGVHHLFDFLVGGDMVTNGKPDPESFLLASSVIGIDPEHCVVFEDGISGMIAADKAGMKCIGIITGEASVYPTENIVKSWREVDIEYLNKLS